MSYHLFCAKFYDVITSAMILYVLGIPEPEPEPEFMGTRTYG